MAPSIAASEKGIWAVKGSFVGLFAPALLQVVAVLISGSVALLSDTIHNFGDAATALPLAFALTRLGTSRRFAFGYGRFEDLARVLVVLIILFSACVAGYQHRGALRSAAGGGALGGFSGLSGWLYRRRGRGRLPHSGGP